MTDNELTYEIRGAIFDVYNTLGPGLLESVYEEALTFELQQRGLEVIRQMEVPIMYKDNELKTPLRLDILVENQVIVELKSVEEMKPVFAKQLLTYLRLLDKHVGLLVNFNTHNLCLTLKKVDTIVNKNGENQKETEEIQSRRKNGDGEASLSRRRKSK